MLKGIYVMRFINGYRPIYTEKKRYFSRTKHSSAMPESQIVRGSMFRAIIVEYCTAERPDSDA